MKGKDSISLRCVVRIMNPSQCPSVCKSVHTSVHWGGLKRVCKGREGLKSHRGAWKGLNKGMKDQRRLGGSCVSLGIEGLWMDCERPGREE